MWRLSPLVYDSVSSEYLFHCLHDSDIHCQLAHKAVYCWKFDLYSAADYRVWGIIVNLTLTLNRWSVHTFFLKDMAWNLFQGPYFIRVVDIRFVLLNGCAKIFKDRNTRQFSQIVWGTGFNIGLTAHFFLHGSLIYPCLHVKCSLNTIYLLMKNYQLYK